MRRSGLIAVSTVLLLGFIPLLAQQEPPASPPASPAASAASAPAPPAPVTPEEGARLRSEIVRLTAEVARLRQELADCQMQRSESQRDAQELRLFISDHQEYGKDFQEYQAVKASAEREARARQLEAARARREAERQERRQRAFEARKTRAQQNAEESRLDRYRQAGFAAIGLDVFVGRMAFSYPSKESSGSFVDYDPIVGLYYRPGFAYDRIDYQHMTISGSVLNAAEEVRNIGIAIAFFDENDNQVGGQVIQINNARPDVPYPFTATLDMALNRAFASSTTYVVYADPIE